MSLPIPSRLQQRLGRLLVVSTLAFLAGRSPAPAEQPPTVNIAFVGNSYTFRNNLPVVVASLLHSSHVLEPEIDGSLKGGYRLEQHAADPQALRLLQRGAASGDPWDIVVVQEQSVLSGYAATNDEARQAMTKGLTTLASVAFRANAKALILDFQVWTRHASLWRQDSQEARMTGADPTQAHRHIREANAAAVNAARESVPGVRIQISPVGDFWKLAQETYPDLSLYEEDGSHPSITGTYLTGLIIAGNIGGRAVIEKATWTGECPAEAAKKLRQLLLDHPEVFKSAGK